MHYGFLDIAGMHCRSCELLLEEHLRKVPRVASVKVSYAKGEAAIGYEDVTPSDHKLEQAIREAGYTVGIAEKPRWFTRSAKDLWEIGIGALILLALYFVARWTGLLGVSVKTENLSLPFAIVVGLVAGISTCMAVVGGLILGISARYSEEHPEATRWEKFRPHLQFNAGRIIGYAAFGGLLGALGSVLKLSNGILAILTIGVGLVLLFLGLKLTGLSPRLETMSFTLPSRIGKRLGLGGNKTKARSSMLTGALTFFLPCGFTQAMQLYAISTGSFARGALVLGLFALGTAPALLSLGGLSAVVKGAFAKRFYVTVGLAVLVFGLVNVRNGLALTGFNPSSGNGAQPAALTSEVKDGIQTVRMAQKADGYEPNSFTILKDVPVRWIITSESAYSCAAFIRMPKKNISVDLKAGENVVEFTPTEAGKLQFSCSMGMYRGTFTVVEKDAANGLAAAAAPSQRPKPSGIAPKAGGGSCGAGGCGCGGGGAAPAKAPDDAPAAAVEGGVQKITSRDNGGQLDPVAIKVKAGTPVEWTVDATRPSGCMTAFLNPDLGLDQNQAQSGPTVMQFTPTKPGDYTVTCGMGMFRGIIQVIS